MVFQQFINYPNLSVYENIASPLRVARVAEAAVRDRVGQVAELLQLSPFLQRRPSELSGGQQQRTALARALVKDADLVLLDEPLANLDYKLREGLRDELPRLFAGRASTVVYATSDPSEALLLGGHTATVHEGRITQYGPNGAVYRRPVDLTTARVFSDPPINTAEVVKRGDRVELSELVSWTAEGGLRALSDGVYTIGLRPHHVLPATGRGGLGTGRLPGADRRDQRIGERDPFRPRRSDLGLALARCARVQGGRNSALRAGRRQMPVLRAGRLAGRRLNGRRGWHASVSSRCGTATCPSRRVSPIGR